MTMKSLVIDALGHLRAVKYAIREEYGIEQSPPALACTERALVMMLAEVGGCSSEDAEDYVKNTLGLKPWKEK